MAKKLETKETKETVAETSTAATPAATTNPTPFSIQVAQNKLNEALKGLDTYLSQYHYAKEFHRMTGVQTSYVALGAGGVAFLMIFFNIAGQLLTNLISWLYPAYRSFKAIESEEKGDDTQWLTYWTVIGFIQMIEYFSDFILYWFPFYYLFKTLIVLYLYLPQFQGAEVLYIRFFRPFIIRAEDKIDSKKE